MTVTFPDGSTGTALVPAGGTFSITSALPQTSGNVTTTQKDAANNVSTTDTDVYTDTTAPLAPSTPTVTQNPTGTITVTGSGEPGSTVTVTYPDGTTGTVVVPPSGSYSLTSPMPQGTGTVAVKQTDGAGNTSALSSTSFVDTQAPLLPVATTTQNPDGTLTTAGTGEPGSTVTVKYPDGTSETTLVKPDGTFTLTSPMPQGTGTVTTTQTDAAGNLSLTDTDTIIDRVAPPLMPSQNITGSDSRQSVGSEQRLLQGEGMARASANGDLSAHQASRLEGSFMNIAGSLNGDSPVMAAVNQVASLGGLQHLSGDRELSGGANERGNGGVVSHQVRNSDPAVNGRSVFSTPVFGRSWVPSEPEGLSGFSLRFGDYGPQQDVIAIESIVRRGTLMLQLGTANHREAELVRSYSITMLDGSELPAWLQQAGPDLLIGKVPANVERIAVRVTAVMSDGRINTRDVVIQTRTGEIQPVAPERRSEVVPLFSRQLESREALTGEEVQILGRALAGRRR